MKRTGLRLTYANEIRREIQRRYKNGATCMSLRREYGLTEAQWWGIREGHPQCVGPVDFESLYRKMGRPRAK